MEGWGEAEISIQKQKRFVFRDLWIYTGTPCSSSFPAYFLALITLKFLLLEDHHFSINNFLASPNTGLKLQVQRRQIFCPHPWRTVDSLQALPRPNANRANRSSCRLHSPGDKHEFCSCCCPSSHPRSHWVQGTVPGSSPQPWQVTVGEMLCWGCSSGSSREPWAGKCAGKCVWALPQQTGTVLVWLCQSAAH